jgi:hypothetical protein
MLSDSWSKSSHSNSNGCVEASWHKSSHSANGNCVEVVFRKSSHSANGDCIEVADGCGRVHVRDSKDPDGPVLEFSPGAWMEFLEGLK